MARKRKQPSTPRSTGSADAAYKRLFAEPRIVRDLLLGFVTPGWTARLDFSTLQALPTEHIGDNLKARRKDIVWRVRFRVDDAADLSPPDGSSAVRPPGEAGAGDWLYLVVMIEFQSRDEHFMALRTNEYAAMLYRHLSRLPEHSRAGRVPPILPVVLYNGESGWKAADSVITLIPPLPEPHLRPWLPTHRSYLLIDEVRLARQLGPTPSDNLAELFMHFEASPDDETTQRLIERLQALLAAPAADSLRLAFTAWLNHTMVRRLRETHNLPEKDLPYLELDDMSTVYENNVKRRYEQERQERGADLLIRQLGVRFGELPAGTIERVRAGTADDHDRWAERLLSAPSLDAMFADEPSATH